MQGRFNKRNHNPARRQVSEIAWMLNAADWLDPLVNKYWPTVDIED
jgi:hypothetical protein